MGSPVEKHSGDTHWISDGHGTPRLYRYVNLRQVRWHFRRSGKSKWHRLHERKWSDLEDIYEPIGFGVHPDQLLVIKPHEGRLALWAKDLTGKEADKVVFSHPEVDVGDHKVLGKFKRIVAVGYSTDKPHFYFIDEAIQKISGVLAAYFSGKTVEVIDESWDRRYYIVHAGSDRDPGAFYRFDTEAKQLLKISLQYPELKSRALSVMKPIRYPASDGTEIPSYLTLPADAEEGSLPAVILPHGGPWSRDYWEFDWLSQFFAAKGYAVLQSNYRGSAGYGSEWQGDGGFRAWRTAIGDLTDGAQYLIDQGIADDKRICVVGWSYGGYAALMSGIEEPERYCCVVSIAGVTDPKMVIDDARYAWSRYAVHKAISRDDEVVKRGSPLARAAEIRVPVLLFHGDDDVNVSIEHSVKLADALERAEKSVEFIEYDDAEHSIRRNGYRVDMLDRIGSFLDTHIGQPAAAP